MNARNRRRFLTVAAIATGCLAAYAQPHAEPQAAAPFAPPAPQMDAVRTSPGYLGVDLRDVDAGRAEELKLKSPAGAEVTALDHDAPACKAGVKVGDVILSMDGQQIASADQLRRLMRDMPAGKPVSLALNRKGTEMKLNLKLANREELAKKAWGEHFRPPMPRAPGLSNGFFGGYGPSEPGFAPPPAGDRPFHIGVLVQSLSPQLADYFGARSGSGLLVASVEPRSPAEEAGIKAGDVLLAANGTPLTSPMELMGTLRGSAGKPVQLTLLRNHHEQTISVMVKQPSAESRVGPGRENDDTLAALGPMMNRLGAGEPAISPEQLDGMRQQIVTSQKQFAEAQQELAQMDWKSVEAAQQEARRQIESIDFPAMQKQV